MAVFLRNGYKILLTAIHSTNSSLLYRLYYYSISVQSVGGDDGLELTGASAEDTEAELIKKILETEVGGAGGLLSTFEPLIVGVVTNPSKYSCPILQTSASLALAKYMLIRYIHISCNTVVGSQDD